MRTKLFAVIAFVLLAFTGNPASQNPGPAIGNAVSGEILVRFAPLATASDRANAHAQVGGMELAEITRRGLARVAVPAGSELAAIARYQRNPNVLYAEPNFVRRVPEPLSHGSAQIVPADTYFDEEYGLHNTGQLFYCFEVYPNEPEWCFYIGTPDADIDAPEAWAISTGSPAVRVAVIDTGVDYNHPDLAANYVGGDDFTAGDGDPMDDHGHGTHVSGTIAAAMNNLTGDPGKEEGVVGVAPNASILAYKVCDAAGACTDFGIQQAIESAVAAGANVINMSLGSTEYSASLDEAVQYAWSRNVVVVAGAGNNGNTQLFYPAALENVISVGAFDEDHRRASFSNYGSWVDISAPGNVIMSTYPRAGCAGAEPEPGDTGCYTWQSGTSMATPHAAGAAALVWSRADVTSASDVVNILLQSADPAGVDSTRLDSWTRHGGLNVHNAMSYGVINQSPSANAGSDQTVTDSDGDGFENISLDGSGSLDPDGTIVSHEWRENGVLHATGVQPTVSLAVGTHILTLTVTDDDTATSSDDVTITVHAASASTDTVSITKATYRRGQLGVEATSSGAPDVALVVYDSTDAGNPVLIGELSYKPKKGKYSGTYTLPSKPSSILVVSSGGGTAESAVGGK